MVKKQMLIGLIVGLLSNLVGSIIYAHFISDTFILETIKIAYRNGLLTSIISMGAIPNLLLFFLFIKKNKDTIAKGILLATIITAILTLIVKML